MQTEPDSNGKLLTGVSYKLVSFSRTILHDLFFRNANKIEIENRSFDDDNSHAKVTVSISLFSVGASIARQRVGRFKDKENVIIDCWKLVQLRYPAFHIGKLVIWPSVASSDARRFVWHSRVQRLCSVFMQKSHHYQQAETTAVIDGAKQHLVEQGCK